MFAVVLRAFVMPWIHMIYIYTVVTRADWQEASRALERHLRQVKGQIKLNRHLLQQKSKLWSSEPTSGTRDFFNVQIHSSVSTTAFEGFTSLLIVSNITLMSFESYKQASWQTDLTYVSNIWFTMIFGVEGIVKLYTYGVEQYYASVLIFSWSLLAMAV